MEMKTKNRAWVKNVAIILLAVLLVLTLFSNTFMNRSLPEVATAPVSSDSLTVKVRGTGTVKANGTNDVVANQTRKILAVMVKEGDEVEKGDVLFILGEGDSEELAAATAELKQLQQNYQSTALSYPDHTADYEIIESRIHRAEETTLAAERALNQAIDRMNAVATSTNNEGYQNALAQYKQDVAKYYTLIQKYYDDMYSSQKISAQMKQHVDRSLQYSENFTTTDMANAVSELQSRVTEQENSTAIQGVKRLEQELTALENEKTAIEADNAALAQEKNSDLPMVINALDARITELNGLITELQTKIDSDPDSANVAEAQAKIQEYKAMQEQCKTEIAAHEARKTEIDSVIAANNSRLAELAAEISNKQAEVTAAKNDPSTSEAYAKLDAIKTEIKDTVKAFETIKKDLSTMLLEQENYLKEIGSAEVDAARAALESARDAENELKKNYEATKKANAKSDAGISLQLRGISDQIEEAKKKVARLSGEADSQIVAEVPGIVNSIFFTAGNTPPAGEKVASLNVSDAGYTLTFNVTAEQAKRLHVGDEASVTNFYWGSSVTAKLTSIKNDPKDPQNTRILSFDLEGDVTPGAELTLAVGSRSMSYDHVVPKNAVRKDNNGTFVLVVKSENTALGNKYTASRMDVTVLAEDDTLAAITGDFEWSAYVITQSSDGTQIKNGDRVRLADS